MPKIKILLPKKHPRSWSLSSSRPSSSTTGRLETLWHLDSHRNNPLKTDYSSICQTVERAIKGLIALHVQLQCILHFPLKVTFYRYEGINEIMSEKWNDMIKVL